MEATILTASPYKRKLKEAETIRTEKKQASVKSCRETYSQQQDNKERFSSKKGTSP